MRAWRGERRHTEVCGIRDNCVPTKSWLSLVPTFLMHFDIYAAPVAPKAIVPDDCDVLDDCSRSTILYKNAILGRITNENSLDYCIPNSRERDHHTVRYRCYRLPVNRKIV